MKYKQQFPCGMISEFETEGIMTIPHSPCPIHGVYCHKDLPKQSPPYKKMEEETHTAKIQGSKDGAIYLFAIVLGIVGFGFLPFAWPLGLVLLISAFAIVLVKMRMKK